jgi:putative SOS response-associated peptidase YedK
MCGRYVSPDEAAMEREYHLGRHNSGTLLGPLGQQYTQSFNLAPSQDVPVIRVVRNMHGQREVLTMRWGLIAAWAKGEVPKFPTHNATIEKIETAATWRGPWQRSQRCIMPALGFYEWQVQADGSKIPFYIRPATDNTTFAIAALWDESRNAAGDSILSSAIITMPANELLAKIHNTKMRMPAIIRATDIEVWLTGTPTEAKAVLQPMPSDEMVAWPVNKRVNSAKNNDPALIAAVD